MKLLISLGRANTMEMNAALPLLSSDHSPSVVYFRLLLLLLLFSSSPSYQRCDSRLGPSLPESFNLGEDV